MKGERAAVAQRAGGSLAHWPPVRSCRPPERVLGIAKKPRGGGHCSFSVLSLRSFPDRSSLAGADLGAEGAGVNDLDPQQPDGEARTC